MYKVETAIIVITYLVSYRNDIISFALYHQMTRFLQNDTRNRHLYIFNMK